MGGSGICGVGEVLGALAAPLSRQWVVREGGRFSTCCVNCERKMTHVVDRWGRQSTEEVLILLVCFRLIFVVMFCAQLGQRRTTCKALRPRWQLVKCYPSPPLCGRFLRDMPRGSFPGTAGVLACMFLLFPR